jgi:hypothetical protein
MEYKKYIKYKQKYLNLKKQLGGKKYNKILIGGNSFSIGYDFNISENNSEEKHRLTFFLSRDTDNRYKMSFGIQKFSDNGHSVLVFNEYNDFEIIKFLDDINPYINENIIFGDLLQSEKIEYIKFIRYVVSLIDEIIALAATTEESENSIITKIIASIPRNNTNDLNGNSVDINGNIPSINYLNSYKTELENFITNNS